MGDEEITKREKSKMSMTAVKSEMRVKSATKTKSLTQHGTLTSRIQMRRPSYGFAGVPSIRPVERTSQLGIEFKRPPLVFLNTYQLDPHPELKFHVAKVKQATEELLDELFTGHKYNVQESPALAMRIAGEVMRKVKTMQFNRYRIFTVCTIGQKRSQSYNNAVTFIWDHERDNYVDVQREVTTVFVQVTTFGVYID